VKKLPNRLLQLEGTTNKQDPQTYRSRIKLIHTLSLLENF